MAANSAVQGRIWLKLKLIRDVIVILVTSKNEEDLIKTEGARVATTQNIDFQTLKGSLLCSERSDLAIFELVEDIMDAIVTSKTKRISE